jgi:queuine tRNA-ribosyltransferase
MLLSFANVWFYQELMARARAAIDAGRFSDFVEDVSRRYSSTSTIEDETSS